MGTGDDPGAPPVMEDGVDIIILSEAATIVSIRFCAEITLRFRRFSGTLKRNCTNSSFSSPSLLLLLEVVFSFGLLFFFVLLFDMEDVLLLPPWTSFGTLVDVGLVLLFILGFTRACRSGIL